MMKLLLKLGADIYLESEMGYSPMDLAILMGDKRIIFIYMVIFLMFLNKLGVMQSKIVTNEIICK